MKIRNFTIVTLAALCVCTVLSPLACGRAAAAQTPPPTPSGTIVNLNFSKPDWTAEEPFSIYPSLRQLANGSIIVADSKDVELRLIGNDGKTIKPLGRKGSGPAEYTWPSKLIALSHDSTLLLDREARRVLIIDPTGKFISTQPIPSKLGEGAERLASADPAGRIFFRFETKVEKNEPVRYASIARWQRNRNTIDTVATIELEVPKLENFAVPKDTMVTSMTARRYVKYAAVDDWIAAPSGRIAIIHATPYHVEWIETSGKKTIGPTVAYTPVAVTTNDKKIWEPKGPPFVRTYPETKSPFQIETAVMDESESVWVQRNNMFGSATRSWDVFDATGKLVSSVAIPANRSVAAVNRKYVYLVRSDKDGLQWLERYSR